MKETKKVGSILVSVTALALLTASPVFAHSCKEEIPQVQASIAAMDVDDSVFGDKQIAEKHLATAQERLAQNNEKGCLLYLEAARSTLEAAQYPSDG